MSLHSAQKKKVNGARKMQNIFSLLKGGIFFLAPYNFCKKNHLIIIGKDLFAFARGVNFLFFLTTVHVHVSRSWVYDFKFLGWYWPLPNIENCSLIEKQLIGNLKNISWKPEAVYGILCIVLLSAMIPFVEYYFVQKYM